MTEAIPEARPAATLILLRDAPVQAGGTQLQVLMVRRSASLAFYGGAWAFPGGRVDPADCEAGESLESLAAVQRAAVRELHEEVAMTLTPDQLTCLSIWTTPIVRPKRFKTWFFVTAIDARDAHIDEARVDGSEIDAHQWLTFDDAFSAQREHKMELPPPTFVTLLSLAKFHNTAEVMTELRSRPPQQYFPKLVQVEGGMCSLYDRDAGYVDEDLNRPGARDRLWSVASGWRYERSD